MGLSQLNFAGLDKVTVAKMRLQEFEPSEGYHLAFSGGKDSIVIYDLAVRAGIRFDAHYNVVGIDPPELVYFIREHYPSVILDKPAEKIWSLVERKGLPSRLTRYCCEYLKEYNGAGRRIVTGIRWAESNRRRKRKMIEVCNHDKTKIFLHPIIDWTTSEVWEYIRGTGLSYCSLYDEGFKRLGCVLCPFTTPSQTAIEMARWPKVADAWYRAGKRYYETTTQPRAKYWATYDELWQWWLSRRGEKNDSQCSMFV